VTSNKERRPKGKKERKEKRREENFSLEQDERGCQPGWVVRQRAAEDH
jgi:hypothetical protein